MTSQGTPDIEFAKGIKAKQTNLFHVSLQTQRLPFIQVGHQIRAAVPYWFTFYITNSCSMCVLPSIFGPITAILVGILLQPSDTCL